MPGPWFGGMRFASTAPSDEGWKAHGFARWTMPEVLVWRVGNGLAVAAFAPEEAGRRSWCSPGSSACGRTSRRTTANLGAGPWR